MKKAIKTTLCAILCSALMLLVFAPVYASYYDYEELLNDTDREKLLAFWNTANEEGLTNGEAVFISEYPDAWLDEIGGHEYEGTALTPLVEVVPDDSEEGYSFKFRFYYELDELIPLPDGAPGEGYATVYPELYGELDLSGTLVSALRTNGQHKEYIPSIRLDDCEKLEVIYLGGLDELNELSALDCTMLRTVNVFNCGLQEIDVNLLDYEKAFGLSAFGAGSIGMGYWGDDGPETTLSAYPKADAFVGWFEGGELVSTELEYVRTEGGSLVAVFGGDADGDGAVTVADAVLTMRASMGIIQVANSGMLDVDGSEDIDIADALLVMRFAMGLIG